MIRIARNAVFRGLLLAPALFLWFIFLCLDPLSVNTTVFSFAVGIYLFFVASKAYTHWLTNDRSHLSFWFWFVILLFVSALFILSNYAVGIGGTIIAAFIYDRTIDENGAAPVQLRGGSVLSLQNAKDYYQNARPRNDPGIYFGGVKTNTDAAVNHFAFCGMTGSGKTVSIRLFMQDTLSRVGRDGRRAVIYDPKTQYYPILEGMGIEADDIIVMNPFDTRCRPWDMARDMTSSTLAENLASILVPKTEGGENFWRDASIIAIKAVVRYLNNTAPRVWRFRDLLLGLRSRAIILKMMTSYKPLNHYVQSFGSDRTADNIMATLLTSVERYDPIAALWHKAETLYNTQPYSLSEWANDSKILLLGTSEDAEIQMGAINRIILTRVKQLLLKKPEIDYPESFLILDELASLGDLTPLIDLAEKGRSKGVSMVVGFQSKSHIEENFKEKLAIAFLGQFTHIAALKLREKETAEWISGIIGMRYGIRYPESRRSSFGSLDQYDIREEYFQELVVDPSEIQAIGGFKPKLNQGLKGLYIAETNWWHTYKPSIVKQLASASASPTESPFPEEYQELDDWDAADYQRLNMTQFSV